MSFACVTAVLSDDVYREIETTNVFCAKIINKKATSELIKQINQEFPLPNFGHLKRVKAKDGELFILVAEESSNITEVKNSELANFHVVQVPKHKPITRAQFKAANELWPTQFHENKRLERALNGTLFTDDEVSLIKSFVELTTEECHSQKATAAAVIVDPLTRQVVAKGHTHSSHPLKHAVMVCIDAVAVAQGGGAWSTDLAEKVDASPHDPLAVAPPKRRKLNQQYLCTGYDAYVTMEPCVMCAMALVHSRIRRVFYSSSNEHSGGLGTHFKIHVQTGLNHHFEVYRTRITS